MRSGKTARHPAELLSANPAKQLLKLAAPDNLRKRSMFIRDMLPDATEIFRKRHVKAAADEDFGWSYVEIKARTVVLAKPGVREDRRDMCLIR